MIDLDINTIIKNDFPINITENIIIRLAKPEDAFNLCNVCIRTADSGKDASNQFKDVTLPGKRWVLSYLELQPDLSLVLEDMNTNHIVGYALGCKDTLKFEKELQEKYLPKMQQIYNSSHDINESDKFYKDMSIIKEFYEFRNCPSIISDTYKAHVHIDIIEEYQGQSLGRLLFSTLLRLLRINNCKKVHLEMHKNNHRALKFYNRAGFKRLAQVNAKNGDIISSQLWKFDPSALTKDSTTISDDNIILYLGLSLEYGDGLLKHDWNPATSGKLICEKDAFINLRKKKMGDIDNNDNSSHTNSNSNSVLVCTVPEAWKIVQAYFPNHHADEKGNPSPNTSNNNSTNQRSKTFIFFVTSMDETHVTSTIKSYQNLNISEVYGVGGGSACDFAKMASGLLDIPLYLVPSILSVDAPFTRAAGLRTVTNGRVGVRYTGDASLRLKKLIIDSNLLNQAPKILNNSGVGDIVSIVTAIWDWNEACYRQGEEYDENIASFSLQIVNNLINHVDEIYEGSDKGYQILSECFSEEVALCEGWGNSRPEEGSEHYLAYNIESRTGRGYIHGRLVGLCTLIVHVLQYYQSQSKIQSTDNDDKIILENCENAKILSKFFKTLQLDCNMNDDGMPTEAEIKDALLSMSTFLEIETQLLPGYFHFFGDPSIELVNRVIEAVKILLQQ